MSPGTSNQLGVSVEIMTASESMLKRYTNPVDRNCYKNEDISLKFFPYYKDHRFSLSNCLLESSMQYAESKCGCVPGSESLPGTIYTSDTQCHGTDLFCFNSILNTIGADWNTGFLDRFGFERINYIIEGSIML